MFSVLTWESPTRSNPLPAQPTKTVGGHRPTGFLPRAPFPSKGVSSQTRRNVRGSASQARPRTVRLIHTADWHLGQSFYSHDRAFEHQRFLDWLLETLVAERADVLLVAGDVFDNANPSAESQRQLYRFLSRA